MDSKHFTSANRWFSMEIPTDWEEYDDDEEGTFAFFNSKNWTGNLRITPLRNSDSPDRDMAKELLASEFKENKTAKKITLGSMEAIKYKNDIKQDGEDMVMYYWTTGKKNIFFVCSFTINKDMDSTKDNQRELELVEKILSTIKINLR